jgi:hypothetical protein
VILGSDDFPHFRSLNAGLQFRRSADAVEAYLKDASGLALREADVLNLFNSGRSADEQLLEVGDFIRNWVEKWGGGEAASLTDLLLYYVGHGDFIGTSTEFLMLVRTSRPRREMTSIQARALATVLRDEAPFVRQVVILDCCWSGAAHRIWQSGEAAKIAAKGTAALMPNNGTVLLCSSSEDLPSMAPKGAERTMFTGALIDSLRVGNPNIEGDLSPRQTRDLAFDAMRKRWGADAVRPVIHAIDRGSGDLSDMPVFPNPGKAANSGPEERTHQESAEKSSWSRRNLLAAALPAGATLGAASLIGWLEFRGNSVKPRDQNTRPPAEASMDAAGNSTAAESPEPAKIANPVSAAPLDRSAPGIRNGCAWFKERFGSRMREATAGTPFTASFLTGLAVTETYYLWGSSLPPMATADLLELCVGDTIPTRSAFPRDREALLAAPRGRRMLQLARDALVKASTYNPLLASAVRDPNRFVHTFGVFARDLQFFVTDPEFFLQKQWRDFNACLRHLMPELRDAARRALGNDPSSLSREEFARVGIAFNSGRYVPDRGLRQGYFDGKLFYGENLLENTRIAESVPDSA